MEHLELVIQFLSSEPKWNSDLRLNLGPPAQLPSPEPPWHHHHLSPPTINMLPAPPWPYTCSENLGWQASLGGVPSEGFWEESDVEIPKVP